MWRGKSFKTTPVRRAFSSVGRASPLQGEGQKFESSNAHHKKQDDISYPVFYFVVLMTWTSNCVCNLIKFMTNEKIICHAEQAEQRMKA